MANRLAPQTGIIALELQHHFNFSFAFSVCQSLSNISLYKKDLSRRALEYVVRQCLADAGENGGPVPGTALLIQHGWGIVKSVNSTWDQLRRVSSA